MKPFVGTLSEHIEGMTPSNEGFYYLADTLLALLAWDETEIA